MPPIEKDIIVAAEWVTFLALLALTVWGTGYLIWLTAQASGMIESWVSSRRRKLEERARQDLDFQEQKRRLELAKLKETQEIELQILKEKKLMELNFERANRFAMAQELAPNMEMITTFPESKKTK